MAGSAALTPAASSGLARLAADTAGASPLPVALYVHVPFCLSKCAYCDFYSVADGERWREPFVDAALFEAGHWSHYDLLDDVPTLYIGGGTPTVLGEGLVRLVHGLRLTARLRDDAEVTVETNPEATTAELVAALKAEGVNRFSLGVQSFDDAVLRTLGRCHDAERALEATRVLERARVPFSIDLMCGVPGQSYESWESSLEQAVACGARHVSVYPLTVEEGTPLDASIRAGSLPAPDPDVAADMMLSAEVALAAAGMPRYEVANYAQPGFESRHNLGYWTGQPYLGIGPHAASMLPYDEFARVAEGEGWADGSSPLEPRPSRARFTREADLGQYVRRPLAHPGPIELLDAAQVEREDVMLGLRVARGVSGGQVEAAGLREVITGLAERGLVSAYRAEGGDTFWRTTQRGWLLGNEVFRAVWLAG
jgi:oxygen-independent coproporphyrinogen III oxidase